MFSSFNNKVWTQNQTQIMEYKNEKIKRILKEINKSVEQYEKKIVVQLVVWLGGSSYYSFQDILFLMSLFFRCDKSKNSTQKLCSSKYTQNISSQLTALYSKNMLSMQHKFPVQLFESLTFDIKNALTTKHKSAIKCINVIPFYYNCKKSSHHVLNIWIMFLIDGYCLVLC